MGRGKYYRHDMLDSQLKPPMRLSLIDIDVPYPL